MDDLTRLWNAATTFADAHPLLTWIVVTSVLNALVRAWPRLQHTLPGRLFSLLCQGLGVDALGVLKVGAAGAGARALTMAAGGLGTSPEALKGSPASLPPPPSTPPAILDTTSPAPEGEAPGTPRSGAPAAPTGLGGNGRRS